MLPDLVDAATQLVVEGVQSDAVVELAGTSSDVVTGDLWDVVGQAVVHLGYPAPVGPGRYDADELLRFVREFARRTVTGTVSGHDFADATYRQIELNRGMPWDIPAALAGIRDAWYDMDFGLAQRPFGGSSEEAAILEARELAEAERLAVLRIAGDREGSAQ